MVVNTSVKYTVPPRLVLVISAFGNSIRRSYTGIPRRKEAYTPGTRWRAKGLTYSFAVSAMDWLVAQGYLMQKKGFSDPYTGVSRLTRLFATDRLGEKLDIDSIGHRIRYAEPRDTVVLRTSIFRFRSLRNPIQMYRGLK